MSKLIGILLASGASLASALALPGAAEMDEDATLDFLRKLKAGHDRMMGLAGVTDPALLEPTIAKLKAQADEAVTLRAQVLEINAKAESSEREGLIQGLLSSHAITPALEPWARSVELSSLREFADKAAPPAAPVTAPAGESSGAGVNKSVALSAGEQAVIKQLGITQEQYLANRNGRAANN